jgi:L-ascorbate metabolism protein UlaG (beta-lactamase superfamily)
MRHQIIFLFVRDHGNMIREGALAPKLPAPRGGDCACIGGGGMMRSARSHRRVAMGRAVRALLSLLLSLPLLPGGAFACGAIAGNGRVIRAAAGPDEVEVTFLGHASFLIVTPGGVAVATDYSGAHPPPRVPDVVTMNHAHSTHFTDAPDPRIPYVLRGWGENGRPRLHDLQLRDLRVRNLPTNIRNWSGGTELYGNSIFVFETAGLCIAHLGHLHHLLTADDLATLGTLDIVMAPIDGAMTMAQGDIATVLDQLHPRLVLPMHYFSTQTLQHFIARMRDRYDVAFSPEPTTTLSHTTLPPKPQILVLPGPLF